MTKPEPDSTIEWAEPQKKLRGLSDFDPTKIRTADEADTWMTFVLHLVAVTLFIGGLLMVGLLWWITGKRD